MYLSKLYAYAAFLCAAATLTMVASLQAQPKGVKFWKITAQDLAVSANDWPDAAAVVLFDVGYIRFEYNQEKGFQSKFTRHTRIKILGSSGLDWADVVVPFFESNQGKEAVSAVKASAFNSVNGTIEETKMERSALFEEEIDKNWRNLKFTLPEVREGTIIEFSYEVSSDFLATLPTWYFQQTIPMIWSELEVEIPEYFTYSQFMLNGNPFEKSETGSSSQTVTFTYMEDLSTDSKLVNKRPRATTLNFINRKWLWVQENMPAFGKEPFITATSDYLARIEFNLSAVAFPNGGYENVIPTWEELIKTLNEDSDFGKFANKTSSLKEIVAPLIAQAADNPEKARLIFRWVQQQFKWNEQHRMFANQSFNDFLKKRVGNSAEINLLLVALLREAGLQAFPVLLSTRDNGKVKELMPLLREFNHVVACVVSGEDGTLYDASNPLLVPEMLAPESLNGSGLLVMENNYGWLPLLGSFKEIAYHNMAVKLNDEGLEGTVSVGYKGFKALNMRKNIAQKGPEEVAKEDMADLLREGTLEEVSFEAGNPNEAFFKGQSKFVTSGFVQRSDSLVYIDPLMGFGIKENPFKKPERVFEVDFAYPFDETLQFSLELPQGYEVLELPAAKRIAWADGTLKFDYLVEKSATQVKVIYRFSRKRAVFKPEEYKDLRDFYDQIVSISGAQLVLKKG